MQIQIEETEQGNPALYQIMGDQVGSSFYREIVNSDGSPKHCISTKFNGYITNEIKFLVRIDVGDYIFDKRRDNSLNKWVMDVYRIIDIDYKIVPTAQLQFLETINLRTFRSYKMNLKSYKQIEI